MLIWVDILGTSFKVGGMGWGKLNHLPHVYKSLGLQNVKLGSYVQTRVEFQKI